MKPELGLFIKDRKTFVGPSGPLDCEFATITEQPGRVEILKRKPLVGPAGQLYDGCLQSARLVRAEIYHTNVIKDLDLPLKYYIEGAYKKRKASWTSLGQNYLDILRDELEKCNANVFLAMGNVALFALTSRWYITNWRGVPIESTLLPGRKVIPTFHPATYTDEKLWKNPKAWLNKHLIIMDMILAKKESKFPDIIRKPRKIYIKPSYIECMEFLSTCTQLGLQGTIIDYDIEISNMELSAISFSYNPNVAISIPFVQPGRDYFTPEQEAKMMLCIQAIYH